MSFDIPSHIEPMIQQFAVEHKISQDEAIVRLIQEGFSASQEANPSENFDHLFTTDRLANLDAITTMIEAGEPTLDAKQVDARLAATKNNWQAKNAS